MALIEVLEYLDNTGRVMVKRVPDNGVAEITWGAQLTVRESQVAVFFRDGKALDVFESGRYVLQTQNVPVVGKWVTSFAYGPTSPFRSEVYFLSMKLYPNLKWGTREPILFKDSELKMIRLRCNGIYSIQISDPSLFLNKVVGTQGIYQDTEIEDYLRNIVIAKFTETLGSTLKTVFDMPKDFGQLALIIKSTLQSDFAGLGLSLHDFFVNSISLPPEVQQMIDTKTGMTALGNMDEFVKFKAAMALESAAENPNGGGSTGVGVGAGLGMGFMLPQLLQQAMQGGQTQTVSAAQKESPTDKIKKLKELLDMGAITKEEFETSKTKLLQDI